MKARINLYHREFRPTFEWITGSHLLMLVGISVLLTGVVYGGLLSWKQNIQLDADALAQRVKQEQQNINELTDALQARLNNPMLSAQLNNLQLQISSQDTLLLRVKDMGELKQKSFSGLFDALASANSDYVWITNFTLDESDLNIVGSIAKPSALTKWISDLSSTTFFSGQEFSDARVERADGELVFHLNSSKKPSELLVAQGGGNASN
ncbi:PilN domain-containing protein [Glaciecola sp. SC05]|uniref:PilN domain-containing protein n=1 Tax=Glaciecola sp. SC05 TaxID=1987355 RepID=UPI003527DC1B